MPPKKKLGAEDKKPRQPLAAPPPPPPTAAAQHHHKQHPLDGKNVVFIGSFKAKRKAFEACVAGLGGKPKAAVSSKTDFVVKGAKNATDGLIEAIERDIPVWTEDQFDAVCKDGWSAVPAQRPMPSILQCLVDVPELSEQCRKATISRLTYYLYDADSPLLSLSSKFPLGANGGAAVIAPIIKAWPGTSLLLYNEDLKDVDVKIVMDAILARDKSLPAMEQVQFHQNAALSDDGAKHIAEALPKTSLWHVGCSFTDISKDGLRTLLKAVEKTPTMKSVNICLEEVRGGQDVYDEWKKAKRIDEDRSFFVC